MSHYRRNLRTFILACSVMCFAPAHAENPIIPNQGINDPHIRIFGDSAYLYASHDASAANKTFVMRDWTVWKSQDLVRWTRVSTLRPEDTYIKDPGFSSAWATDAAEKNGRFYWYFSEGNRQTGVVVGDTPAGPWRDVLGRPLLSENLTPTHEYDPGILSVGEDRYIVFGVFDYYIAKLADDMISLAEAPRKIEIDGARGPYTDESTGPFAGKKTDDKPFLHERDGKYYLSWGAFYAIADSPYGPYRYKGRIFEPESFAPGYGAPTWPVGFFQGRHGSFFTWHGQWYVAYCDISQTGNRYFRDTFISYVHYRDDGTIAPIRVDGIGVGTYDGSAAIEAENFFAVEGLRVKEHAGASGGFVVDGENGLLRFPNVRGLSGKRRIALNFVEDARVRISVSRIGASAPIVSRTLRVRAGTPATLDLGPLGETESLQVQLDSSSGRIKLDGLSFR
jgi:hypothetical protein